MFNKELIITLLNINKIGRQSVNKLICNPLPLSNDPWCIFDFIIKHMPNYNLKLDIQDIIIAKNKSLNIINYCKDNNINIMTILDNEFPMKLKIIPNNPVVIFYKGNKLCILDDRSIAIVGTRKPNLESEKLTRQISQLFSRQGYTIISGLAYGIDYNAHISAVNNKSKTLAVLPSGISNIYPSEHKYLCDEILYNNGCIISEYFPFEVPYKNKFIERNRLQSALSLGVIIVECSAKSGTMHTVNFAKDQSKIIFCYKNANDHLLKDKGIYVFNNLFTLESMLNLLEFKLQEFNNFNDESIFSDFQLHFRF